MVLRETSLFMEFIDSAYHQPHQTENTAVFVQIFTDIKYTSCFSAETTREICRVMIHSRTSMSLRDQNHQTPTWTRSVGADFLWWRKTPYCTVMSMIRTKKSHQSVGEALPPMVRPQSCLKVGVCMCVCGQYYNIDIPCDSLLQAGSGPFQCLWNTTGQETTKTWPS